MPVVVKTIQETTQAITRPVVLGAVELIKRYTGISDDVLVQVFSNANAAALPGTTIGSKGINETRFDSHEKIQADYTEEYEDNDILTTAVNWADNVPVFVDEALKIGIRPILAKAKVTIQVHYRLPNEAAASRWLADLRTYAGMERVELPMELPYSYQIPNEFMIRLAHLHELREKVSGYNQSFVQYLRQGFDARTTVDRTHGNKGHVFTVKEVQGGILGWFDFTTPPTPERNDTNGSWIASFTFTFIYDKPISTIMNYPIVVHNQLIGSAFRPKATPYSMTEKRLMNISRVAGERLPYTRPRPFQHPIGGFVVPSYDDWNPSRVFDKSTTSIFTTLLFVDSGDPYQICNLNQMGRWAIKPLFLEWIKQNKKLVFNPSMSPLLFEVYTGDTRWVPEALYLDDNLNLRTVSALDERQVHHLRIALVTDLSALSEPYAKNLRESGEVCLEVLRSVDPTLEKRGLIPRLRGGKMVAALDWYESVKGVGTTDPIWKTRPEYRRNTVGQFIFYTGDRDANI